MSSAPQQIITTKICIKYYIFLLWRRLKPHRKAGSPISLETKRWGGIHFHLSDSSSGTNLICVSDKFRQQDLCAAGWLTTTKKYSLSVNDAASSVEADTAVQNQQGTLFGSEQRSSDLLGTMWRKWWLGPGLWSSLVEDMRCYFWL